MYAIRSYYEFIRFHGAYCLPQPVNVNKRVPILIGGDTKVAARRAGRIGDGYFPARGVPEELFALARETAIAAGRDPAELEFTASLPVITSYSIHYTKLYDHRPFYVRPIRLIEHGCERQS